MLSFVRLAAIDEEVFSNLYDQSTTYLDAGTYPWDRLSPMSAAEKKAHIRSQFDLVRRAPRSILWQVSKGSLPLMLNVGYIQRVMLLWRLGLSGADENGSRSWLYHESYRTARDAFWTQIRVEGYQMSAVEGGSVHGHAVSRQGLEALRSDTSVAGEVSPGVIDIVFRRKAD